MKKICLTLLCIILFTACGTKRQYFNPEKVEAKLSADDNLPSKIVDWNLYSAKLSNNQALDETGLIEHFKLEKDYALLSHVDNEFIVADSKGNLKIFNANNEELYHQKFDAAVVSVSINGDDIALILANNSIVLSNRSLGIKMSQTLTPAVGEDSRIAAPYFLNSIIVYPTLDGKLIIFSRNTEQTVRDVVIGTENFFNNVFYLSIVDDKMIAATAKKLIVVSPNQTFSLDQEIRDLALSDDFIFILTKDGDIIKTDFNLNILGEKKFDFAIFTKSNVYNKNLYVFEKTGYLIKSDLNLENIQIFELKEAKDKQSFMKDGKFYYGNKILNLQ